MPKKKKDLSKVKASISNLFTLAAKDKERGDRYIEIARKMSMKNRLGLTAEQRRKICKHCKALIRPGLTSRIRIEKGNIVMFCMRCRNFTRFPIEKPNQRKVNKLGNSSRQKVILSQS